MARRFPVLPQLLAIGCLLAAPTADAQMASKPIVLKKPVMVGGTLTVRPGKLNAAASRALLLQKNAMAKRRPKLIVGMTMTVPGIARVNGEASGNFEPGGAYEIVGHGFGTTKPSVFILLGGKSISLDVTSFADDQIFVSVPDSISGFADFASVTLNVGSPGKRVLSTTKFGFRAAREDSALPLDRLFSAMAGAPASTKTQDGFLMVSRQTTDSGGQKRCITEGTDTIRFAPLKPGFEMTGYVWFHESDEARRSDGSSSLPRGKYSLTIDGDVVRAGYAVMRDYTPPFGMLSAFGACHSEYRLKLIVTGPRGMSPL